ncbi:hypothetical protein FISHEDRAFT_59083 [Fistulina hepatica ATCC 64428]|uniref:RTA1-domain-containing protein n=1 Tax=Fistulina hepatica ATCC 64428 TaxID=1128425 RepID=A0A0D7AC81_9AGAR|nr:hypothetical protein FISHEDRAFT_59083 [Fistulina hepatica ATCC 64428]
MMILSKVSSALRVVLAFMAALYVQSNAVFPRSDSSDDVTLMQAALLYTPNTKIAAVVGIIFSITGLLLLYRLIKNRDWWALCLPIGAFCYALGFFVRIAMVNKHQNSRGWLIGQQVLIACSPAAFLAFNYMVYGRIVTQCIGARHSVIRPNRVAVIFVSSDVITLLVQAGGASLMVSADHAKLGQHVFLIGLILQAISYLVFFSLFVRAIISVKSEKVATGKEIWWKGVWVLFASSLPIIVRCIYRCIQVGLGRTNKLSTDEVWFYCLDALPLFLCIVIYVAVWPGLYITGRTDSIAILNTYGMQTYGPGEVYTPLQQPVYA